MLIKCPNWESRGLRSLATFLLLCCAAVASAEPQAVAPKAELPSIEELVRLGAHQSDLRHYDQAIDTFTLVLKLDPKNGVARADRALNYAWTNRLEEAARDLDAAEALIGQTALVHRGRALIAMRRSDDKTAVAELTRSLETEPDSPFALFARAWLYQDALQYDAALADADAYIRARPDEPDPYVLKAQLLNAQGKRDLAIIEASNLSNRFSLNPYGLAAAARIYMSTGRRDWALAAISRAIQLDPKFYYYPFLRAKFRKWNDFGGRHADLLIAQRLDPADLGIATEMGLLDFNLGNWRRAISHFSDVLRKEPKDFGVLAYRAMAYRSARQPKLAEQDYAAALAAASGPDDFDRICWAFANEGLALEWGLAACNRAIALKQSDGSYFKNRALAELRMDRFPEAKRDCDKAIALDKRSAGAHYVCAIVDLSTGDELGADRARRQARDLNPLIDEVFEEYGLYDPDLWP